MTSEVLGSFPRKFELHNSEIETVVDANESFVDRSINVLSY